MNRRYAMLAGSFDPPTAGHENIIRRASQVFECLHVVIAVNPEKKYRYTTEQRLQMLNTIVKDLDNVIVAAWDGLSVDYARRHDIGVMVRGVRNEKDFSYEYDMACKNHSLYPGIETVFLPADASLSHISSSAVRKLKEEGGDLSSMVNSNIRILLT